MTRNRKRYALAALLAFVVATASFAFAASNTVGASRAGDGNGDVSGYTVTPTWTLNTASPDASPTANLTLSASAGDVWARALDASDNQIGSWVDCTGSGTSWQCAFTGQTVASIEGIKVVAAS